MAADRVALIWVVTSIVIFALISETDTSLQNAATGTEVKSQHADSKFGKIENADPLLKVEKKSLLTSITNKLINVIPLPKIVKKPLEFVAGAVESIPTQQLVPYLLKTISSTVGNTILHFFTKKAVPFIIKYAKLPVGPIGALLGIVIPWNIMLASGGLILISLPVAAAAFFFTAVGIVKFLPRLIAKF